MKAFGRIAQKLFLIQTPLIMDKEAAIELAQNYLSVWNAGQSHRLKEYGHPQLEVHYSHFGEGYSDRAAFAEMLEMTHSYFPDLELHFEEIIPSGNQVTIRWTHTGHHQAGEVYGVEASGKYMEVPGMTVLTIKDGKVIKEEGVVDNLAMAVQLGVLD